MAQKATINYVDAILMDIAKGGPKGPFYSVNSLKITYPNGADGTWLVFDTSFGEGAHSFIWDEINSSWKDLGIYQEKGIAEGSVMPSMLSKIAKVPTNFFDKASAINGTYVDAYGVLKTYPNNNVGGISAHISVVEGHVIEWYNDTGSGAGFPQAGAWYDSDGNWVATVNYFSNPPLKVTQTVPPGVKTLRINWGITAFNNNSIYVRDTTITQEKFNFNWLEVNDKNIADDSVKVSMLTQEVLNLISNAAEGYTSKYYGKTAYFVGDSVTVGYGLANQSVERFSYLVGQRLGMTVVNYGSSGTLITKQSGYPNSFVERYAGMGNDADIVFVFGGINDFGVGTSVFGNIDSTNIEEFNGALNVLIKGLQNKFLGKEIIFITPFQHIWDGLNSDLPNSTGKTLKDYRNAILDRCSYHGIPVLDLYSISGMDIAHNPQHKELYAPDGTHPNKAGHEKISERIIGFLNVI